MKFGVNTWVWTSPLTTDELEKLAHFGNVVAVHRPKVPKSHVFEELPRDHEVFERVVHVVNEIPDPFPHVGHLAQELPHLGLDAVETAVGESTGEVTGEGPHVL